MVAPCLKLNLLLLAGMTISSSLFVSLNLHQLTGTSLSTFLNSTIPQIHDGVNNTADAWNPAKFWAGQYQPSFWTRRHGFTRMTSIINKAKLLNIDYADDWRHNSIGTANALIVRTLFLETACQSNLHNSPATTWTLWPVARAGYLFCLFQL